MENVYDLMKEMGVNGRILKEFDIEKDYYDKGVIRHNDLKDGQYYLGKCRNNNIGKWNAKKNVMEYMKCAFGAMYKDDVNYLNNDNGYDLFIAIKEIDEKDVPEEDIVK